jgi:hypothetical protein
MTTTPPHEVVQSEPARSASLAGSRDDTPGCDWLLDPDEDYGLQQYCGKPARTEFVLRWCHERNPERHPRCHQHDHNPAFLRLVDRGEWEQVTL